MARYKVILAYDGTEFQGFQRQLKARSVQGVVEAALGKIGWQGDSILGAGRTDAGVHASGQVITFDLEWAHSLEELRNAINAHLPADVSAMDVQKKHDAFHTRYDALSREYCYRILIDPVRQPLVERYAWRLNYQLDLMKLQKTANLFLGRHDFSAYGTPPRPDSSPNREVTRSEWSVDHQLLCYHVRADAFLYHMVRRLVFVQVMTAAGKIDYDLLASNLERGNPEHPGIAPAHGLELVEVRYE